MSSANVFSWLDGSGWLIFASSASDEVRALALGRASADGGMAIIALSGDAELLLDDLEDLGAPSGYIVDLYSEDDGAITERLADSGIIIVTGGESPQAARGALRGAALDGLQTAYENGALILFEGFAAMCMGGWMIDADDTIEAGLDWVESALILINVENAADNAKPLLNAQPTAIAIAIATGSALVLGGDSEIVIWGRVTVALGSAYGT